MPNITSSYSTTRYAEIQAAANNEAITLGQFQKNAVFAVLDGTGAESGYTLDPDTEAKVQQIAGIVGMTPDAYVAAAVEAALVGSDVAVADGGRP